MQYALVGAKRVGWGRDLGAVTTVRATILNPLEPEPIGMYIYRYEGRSKNSDKTE